MSQLFQNYLRQPIDLVKGHGVIVEDQIGNHYLDFTSGIGVMNLGYAVPTLQAAMHAQLDAIWHEPNLYQNALQEEVAALVAPTPEYEVFFCNSGTEANEAAIKWIRKRSGRSKIVTFEQSFHGRTYGSMSATGQAKVQKGFAPLVPDFLTIPFNDEEALLATLNAQIGGVLLEVIQGEGGVIPANSAWLKTLITCCEKYQIAVVVDEVQTGMGRTGSLYAFEQFGFEPDAFTLAKGLGNGMPVGALVAKKQPSPVFAPGDHGTTFGGNKLAMTAAKEVLKIMREPAFFATLQEKSQDFYRILEEACVSCPNVQEIRGKGFMLGLVLEGESGPVIEAARENGLLVLSAGANVIRLLPPVTMTLADWKKGVAILAESLKIKEGIQ